MSKLETNTIDTISGSTNLTLGGTNATDITIPSGVTITNNGTQAGLTLSDNILFNTANKGIYLGVTTPTASNLLDDYEEGTWTPSFEPSSGSFTSVTDGNNVAAKYTKIGDVCYVNCFYRTNAITKGAASGNVRLAGLPFSSADSLSAFIIGYSSDFSGDQPSGALSGGNQTYINLYYRTVANGTPFSLNVTDLGTGNNDNNIYISGVYKVT